MPSSSTDAYLGHVIDIDDVLESLKFANKVW